MKAIVAALNGKKCVIALGFFIIGSAFVLLTGQHIEGFAGADTWQGLIAGGLLGIGTAFGIPGLAHKLAKLQAVVDKGKSFAERNPELVAAVSGIVNAYLQKNADKAAGEPSPRESAEEESTNAESLV